MKDLKNLKGAKMLSNNEQRTISDYLDRKTTKTDQTSSKIEKQIELLQDGANFQYAETYVQNMRNSSRTASPLRPVFRDQGLALGIAIFSKSTARGHFQSSHQNYST